MRLAFIATSLAAVIAGGCAPAVLSTELTSTATAPQAVADDLLAADRAFAAAATTRPAADALAAMLDRDVVLFIVPQPHQARGEAEARELLAKAFEGEPSTLSWTPVRSASRPTAPRGSAMASRRGPSRARIRS